VVLPTTPGDGHICVYQIPGFGKICVDLRIIPQFGARMCVKGLVLKLERLGNDGAFKR
jgi:hypothetical protein